MPLLDLELAKSISDKIAALLARWAPDADSEPGPERDGTAAEFAEKLRRRDLREIQYLGDLEASPRWPEGLWVPDEPNHERVLIRVETARDRVDWAVAVFNGSLVHWEHTTATVDGALTTRVMAPDTHWQLKLEPVEACMREMGLTLVPPAAMRLRFGQWRLSELLDPRGRALFDASRELEHLANSLLDAKGIRSPAQAYQRVLGLLRLGYDPGTLAAALEGRKPTSWVELSGWIEERNPPFAWTREPAEF